MKINNVKNVSGLITFISENTAWSPVTVSNVVHTLGYRKNGGLESLKQLSQILTDCAKHGADCGFSGFIYYSDTIKFFKENRKDIIKNIEYSAIEIGIDILEMVKNFGIFRKQETPTSGEIGRAIWDTQFLHDDLTNLYNVFSWFCLEEIANFWYNNLENNRQFYASLSA